MDFEPAAGIWADLLEGAHVEKPVAIVEMQLAALSAATRASGGGTP